MSEVDETNTERQGITTEEDKTGQQGPCPLLDHKHPKKIFWEAASVLKTLLKERGMEVMIHTTQKVQHAHTKPDVLIRHLTFSLTILGAYDERDPLGGGSHSFISWRMCFRPALACSNAFAITSTVMPSTLISIYIERKNFVT